MTTKRDRYIWRVHGPKGTICWLALTDDDTADTYQKWPEGTLFEQKASVFGITKAEADKVIAVFSGVHDD